MKPKYFVNQCPAISSIIDTNKLLIMQVWCSNKRSVFTAGLEYI